MFNFFVPTTGSVLKQFVTLKTKLEKVIEYHNNSARSKALQIVAHDAEVHAASKALQAVEKFV